MNNQQGNQTSQAGKNSSGKNLRDDPINTQINHNFAADKPLEFLKREHDLIKSLFERYLTTQDMEVRRQVAPRILMYLEMHASLEEATFYPNVRQVDPALVKDCKHEHEQADQMIHQLKGMNIDDQRYEQTMRQLHDAVMHHIHEEEHRLFPEVKKSNADLQRIGIEMQEYDSNAMALRAERTEQRDVTAPQAKHH